MKSSGPKLLESARYRLIPALVCQNVKPEDGTAAVTPESPARLASVGLQYGFFIGCLGPVDNENKTARYARHPPRQAGAKFGALQLPPNNWPVSR
ncbi:hypothetical protein EN868_13730 [Mesorhizobium sp. M2D.F.Ca.ET.225.01.1.1]|uniref:hypothetical protein n=1 Tax=unclassified Mesorhizobium TaxID=325217 RepID=UPI000FCA86F6|nr:MULTISPECIES: hypothetical protein [unclassified Mesorhizobium]TGP67748.1 hypothetical protein EN868_13730 [Mesorhizobium sp. M2D.F.Ca.ET.225.01.1.1]TGQ00769.1 hypothetical protein EN864_01970 [bacterium M00.F.Ca.ET.221.01.1.1]TGQ02710.1 hypothetical protein EN865_01935 [bacterium M00.F.Ca.ET.222.01.1.1]TGQ25532.1 hypothetical protein EN863_057015 [Mesorhizobium sp. M00.F.Ca.ET.220.01.1.1]TGV72323.1 hypothetical protein EN803_01925 [Mesorhizobium sp. M2D.F.Ca.ET.160.01.1.1]TGV80865.1 hypot